MRSIKILAAILIITAPLLLHSKEKDVEIQMQVMIPMRDGVELSADIYMPAERSGPVHALFILTPYGGNRVHDDAMRFAAEGYAVLGVDCRGRGNSGGEFIPFVNEGKDGYDVCKWISEQPWSSGKIGMFGGSYLGMVQWLVLKENPPWLLSVIPTATVAPGIDFPKFNNIYYTYNTQWLAFVMGNTLNRSMFIDHNYWNSVFREYLTSFVSYYTLDKLSGFESDVFQAWIEHPFFDDYYKSILPSKEDYEEIQIPLLTITGHFDDDQPGTMYYYLNYQKYASKGAKDMCYMIIGPWNHGGTRHPAKNMGDLEFDDNSLIDMNKLYLEWFDWTLRNGKRPDFLQDHVAVYEMGSDKWKYADSLDDLNNEFEEFYLSSQIMPANDVFNSGLLIGAPYESEEADIYVYDPLDTSMVEQKLQDNLIDFSWREEAEAHYPGRLIYHTEPLEKELNIAGFVRFEAYLEMDVRDTDIEAILYEITPDGKCIYLTSAIMRARHRNTIEKEELIEPGEITFFDIDTFHYFAREISKDSRLRLVFGALNSPYYQKNYNSGRSVTSENYNDAVTATVKLYHDERYPSKLLLPVME